MSEKYIPKYWGGNGKLQKELHRLYEKLVPAKGMADSREGELLRCINNFYYDKYNNGLCNFNEYWVNYINEYARMNNLDFKLYRSITEKRLDTVVDMIVEHILMLEKKGELK